MRESFRVRNSIYIRIVCIATVLLIASVIAVSAISYRLYIQDFEAQVVSQTQASVNRLSANIRARLDVPDRQPHEVFEQIVRTENTGIYLMNDEGELLYADTEIEEVDREILLCALRNEDPGYVTAQIGGVPYLLNAQRISAHGLHVVCFSSMAEFNERSDKSLRSTVLAALLISLAASAVLLMVLRNSLSPLRALAGSMSDVRRGDLSVRFHGRGLSGPKERARTHDTPRREHRLSLREGRARWRGFLYGENDEVAYLGDAFNQMMDQIERIIAENDTLTRHAYDSILLQKEAQMAALNSQIRPHFLYNTLNMAAILVRNGEHALAVETIERLSDLMRVITQLKSQSTLREEMRIAELYLGIQCARYADRLSYSTDIAPELLDCEAPVFLLQPILENCVKHGCERKKSRTTIQIAARRAGRYLWMSVIDDGCGIGDTALHRLRGKMRDGWSALTHPQMSGFGLVNVHERIRLQYGDEFGLQVDGFADSGFTVVIRLPFIEAPGKEASEHGPGA